MRLTGTACPGSAGTGGHRCFAPAVTVRVRGSQAEPTVSDVQVASGDTRDHRSQRLIRLRARLGAQAAAHRYWAAAWNLSWSPVGPPLRHHDPPGRRALPTWPTVTIYWHAGLSVTVTALSLARSMDSESVRVRIRLTKAASRAGPGSRLDSDVFAIFGSGDRRSRSGRHRRRRLRRRHGARL